MNIAIMWLVRLTLTLLVQKVRTIEGENFPPPFADVLNYHKSVHLFYQDWLDNSYEKVNFTDKQKAYFYTLQPQTNVNYQKGRSPEIKIFSLTNSNQDLGSMWSRIMSMFEGFHKNLYNYMEESPIMRRYRRDVGGKAYIRIKREDVRKEMKEKGGAAWKRYLLQQRLNRLQRGKGDYTKKERSQKIKALKQLIDRIDKKHPELSKPPKGRKNKNDEPNKTPQPPEFIETVPIDAPYIPTESPTPGAPPGPVTVAPPTDKPKPLHSPDSPDDENLIAPPPPPFTEAPQKENIPTPDPKDLEGIFGNLRRKRHASQVARNQYTHSQLFRRPENNQFNQFSGAQYNKFVVALQQLLSSQVDGLSQYDVFVKSHRLLEAPHAYSQGDSYLWNKGFLHKFESALHQYNPTVQIPYLDMCSLLQQPDVDKLSLWSELLDTPVIPDCAWIGHSLQRKFVHSAVVLDRLNTTLGCTRGPVAQLGMDQYADIHSLFGPCEAGGSHLACPSCAVSDPFFWIISADIDRRMGSVVH